MPAPGALRIVHTADVHIGMESYGRLDPETGLSSRVADFLACFDEVVDAAIREEADLFVFAGDAFRVNTPTPTYLREFAARIMRLTAAGIPCYLLVGNHDLPIGSGRASPIDLFQTFAAPGVVVGSRVGVERIPTRHGDLQVVGIPWVSPGRFLGNEAVRGKTVEAIGQLVIADIQNRISTIADTLDRQTPAIMVGHATFAGSTIATERATWLGHDWVFPISLVTIFPWSYVALGHVHKHQVLAINPPTVYAGSISRVDFAEEHDQKGYVIADLQAGLPATWRFVEVKARPFKTIRIDLRESNPQLLMPAILRRVEEADVDGAVVRVLIRVRHGREDEVEEAPIRRALSRAAYVSAIRCEPEADPARSIVPIPHLEELPPIDVLRKYLQARRLPDDRVSALVTLAEQYLGRLAGHERLADDLVLAEALDALATVPAAESEPPTAADAVVEEVPA